MAQGDETLSKGQLSCKGDCAEQDEWRDFAPTSAMLRVRAEGEVAGLFVLVERAAGHRESVVFEKELIGAIYRFGRILVALFLCLWQEGTPLETRVSRGKEL